MSTWIKVQNWNYNPMIKCMIPKGKDRKRKKKEAPKY